MSGSTEKRTSGAPEQSGAHPILFTWPRAQRMLPLVGQIARDLLECSQRLAQMHPELARLDRQRRDLSWPERARRYQLQEDIALEEKNLHQAEAELETLGVVLLERQEGLLGFPTTVNDSRAFFSWKSGEENLLFWHFQEESVRRPVPPSWMSTTPPRNNKRGASRSESRS